MIALLTLCPCHPVCHRNPLVVGEHGAQTSPPRWLAQRWLTIRPTSLTLAWWSASVGCSWTLSSFWSTLLSLGEGRMEEGMRVPRKRARPEQCWPGVGPALARASLVYTCMVSLKTSSTLRFRGSVLIRCSRFIPRRPTDHTDEKNKTTVLFKPLLKHSLKCFLSVHSYYYHHLKYTYLRWIQKYS